MLPKDQQQSIPPLHQQIVSELRGSIHPLHRVSLPLEGYKACEGRNGVGLDGSFSRILRLCRLGYLLPFETMPSLRVPSPSANTNGYVNGNGTMFKSPSSPHTVILGSGIIGLSAAYFLCESGNTRPESICLVDSSAELFRCASGLAAGFCAKDCTASCATWTTSQANDSAQGSRRRCNHLVRSRLAYTKLSRTSTTGGKHGATRSRPVFRCPRTRSRRSQGQERTGLRTAPAGHSSPATPVPGRRMSVDRSG